MVSGADWGPFCRISVFIEDECWLLVDSEREGLFVVLPGRSCLAVRSEVCMTQTTTLARSGQPFLTARPHPPIHLFSNESIRSIYLTTMEHIYLLASALYAHIDAQNPRKRC